MTETAQVTGITKPLIYNTTRAGVERSELKRVALPRRPAGVQGPQASAGVRPGGNREFNPARLLARRKRAWYFVDAVVCTDACEAPALDEEEAPGGGRSEPVPLLHS